MKKIILSVALIFSISWLMAQDGNVIQLLNAQKKYEEAKVQVDKWLAQPKIKDKDKTEALLWKLYIYGELYSDSALGPKYPDGDVVAMDAFNQYQQLDPSLKQFKDGNFGPGISAIYNGYIQKGNEGWNAKAWDTAFKYFTKADRFRQVLMKTGITQNFSSIDTTMTAFIGVAAQNAKQLDSAAYYFGKLADLKIAGPDYESVYQYLVQYYYNKKDDASFKKYLDLSKELYPNDKSIWSQYEIANMTANSSLTELAQKYQQDVAAGGVTAEKLIGYGEAFATNDSAQVGGLDSTQKVQMKLMAAQAYSKAFELDNSNGLFAFNTGVIYYSLYSELDDRYAAYRGETAALKAKRAAIAKEESAYADTASEWLEKAYPVLKAKTDRSKPETSSLNRTVDYLANIYYWKREQTKSNGQTKDYDKYDALYKKYDAEHNTYQ